MLEIENVTVKNVSYLHARDPSILAWNRAGLDEVRKNLAEELTDKSEGSSSGTQEDHNIQVFLRIKDDLSLENLYCVDGDKLICKVPEGSQALRNVKEGDMVTKTYTFSKIFGPEATQIQLFNSIVKAKMLGFINGKNCTLLTYGASGSGKTFTIVGTPEEPGLIPRALEYVFRTIPQLSEPPKVIPLPNGDIKCMDRYTFQTEKLQKSAILNATLMDRTVHIKTYKQMQQRLSSEAPAQLDDFSNVSVSIWVSFGEIYNEHIYDLLQPPLPRGKQRPKLRLAHTRDNDCYIKDLTSVHVSSGIEAYQVLQYGLHNLKYAATSVNSHSSRSHCIFSIKLIQVSAVENQAYVSNFNFCDLAGSERVKKTMNRGDRLKESNNINASLLVLGRCISNIRSAQQRKDNRIIPFRDSKLTQLFQKALTGLEDIMMIVNINPSRDMFDESQHVLSFSAIAKEIQLEEQPKILKPKKKNRFSEHMEKKQNTVQSRDTIPEEEEEADTIDRLRTIIYNLYTEMESKTREHELEKRMEKEHVISCYKDYVLKLTDSKDREIDKLRKECEELRSLNNHYRAIIKDQQDVISIDSSSEEEEVGSPKKDIIDLKQTISEQTDKINELQQEIRDLKIENGRLASENGITKEQTKLLVEELTKLKLTVKEAEEAYTELQQEVEEEKAKNKQLISENLQLCEKIDCLEEQIGAENSDCSSE